MLTVEPYGYLSIKHTCDTNVSIFSLLYKDNYWYIAGKSSDKI